MHPFIYQRVVARLSASDQVNAKVFASRTKNNIIRGFFKFVTVRPLLDLVISCCII